jgi:hypothetical protein
MIGRIFAGIACAGFVYVAYVVCKKKRMVKRDVANDLSKERSIRGMAVKLQLIDETEGVASLIMSVGLFPWIGAKMFGTGLNTDYSRLDCRLRCLDEIYSVYLEDPKENADTLRYVIRELNEIRERSTEAVSVRYDKWTRLIEKVRGR